MQVQIFTNDYSIYYQNHQASTNTLQSVDDKDNCVYSDMMAECT